MWSWLLSIFVFHLISFLLKIIFFAWRKVFKKNLSVLMHAIFFFHFFADCKFATGPDIFLQINHPFIIAEKLIPRTEPMFFFLPCLVLFTSTCFIPTWLLYFLLCVLKNMDSPSIEHFDFFLFFKSSQSKAEVASNSTINKHKGGSSTI